jgi:hypothetical protein
MLRDWFTFTAIHLIKLLSEVVLVDASALPKILDTLSLCMVVHCPVYSE